MGIYLDYSATTMPDEKVIESFNNVARNYYGNPNSSHDLGKKANKLIEDSIKNICDYLKIKTSEIIFTSGASEANNMVLKGLKGEGRSEIITTKLEHSSIYGPISYLQKNGYSVKFVPMDQNGIIDIKALENMLNKKTLLVSIGAVSSEIGIRQPIEKIGEMLKSYPGIYFHTDITQCLGKDKIDLTNVDLASFSGHKLYGFKGIGGLIKKENVPMEPLIHGGRSTTIYRSGTPQTALIVAMSTSFNLFKDSLDDKYHYVEKLNKKIREHLKKYDKIVVNSPINAIPHILNISFLGYKAHDIQDYFNSKNIYISTQTACSNGTDHSLTIYNLTNDMERAKSSVRISLSYKTTDKEIDEFLHELDLFMEN